MSLYNEAKKYYAELGVDTDKAIEKLKDLGCLDNMSESNQLSLFQIKKNTNFLVSIFSMLF